MSRRKIGIDFGTTNSSIAYVDGEGKPVCFPICGAMYVPTSLAIDGKDRDFGSHANTVHIRDPLIPYYDRFKLDLLRGMNVTLDDELRTPLDLTKMYLELLLDAYRDDNPTEFKKNRKFDCIVLALPQATYDSQTADNKELKKQLISFLQQHSETVHLASEPECACFYYVNSFPKLEDSPNEVLVVDCGGGTIDLALCQISKRTDGFDVKVPKSCGTSVAGMNKDNLGESGVAFDHDVARWIIGSGASNQPERVVADWFGESRVIKSSHVNKMLEAGFDQDWYYDDEDAFSFKAAREPLSVPYQEMNKVFTKGVGKHLDRYINSILGKGKDRSVTPGFMILPTGGFSQFYCVERAIVKAADGTGLKSDKIIAKVDNFVYSVVLGAALKAEQGDIDRAASQISIGIKTYDGLHSDTLTLIEMGHMIKDETEKKGPFYVDSGKTISLQFSQQGREPKIYSVDVSKVIKGSTLVFLSVSYEKGYQLNVIDSDGKRIGAIDLHKEVASYARRVDTGSDDQGG